MNFLNISDYFSVKYLKVLENLFDAICIVLIGMVIIHFLLKMVKRMLTKSSIDEIAVNFIMYCSKIVLRILLVVVALSYLGINTASLITVFGTLGAALALGLKDSFASVVDGISILFAKPFVKGDLIEVNGITGRIQEIQILYTTLITLDNKRVVVPNSQMSSSVIVNYSAEDTRRVDLNIGVGYDADIEHVKQVLLNVVKQNPLSLLDIEPFVRVTDYADSAVIFTLRAWTNNQDFETYKVTLLENIKMAFDQEHISIPYNQLDVNIINKA